MPALDPPTCPRAQRHAQRLRRKMWQAVLLASARPVARGRALATLLDGAQLEIIDTAPPSQCARLTITAPPFHGELQQIYAQQTLEARSIRGLAELLGATLWQSFQDTGHGHATLPVEESR